MLQHALLGVLLRSDVKGGRRTRARKLRLHANPIQDMGLGSHDGMRTGALTGCGLCHPCVGLACWYLVVYVCQRRATLTYLEQSGREVSMLERDAIGRRLEWIAANLRLAVANAVAVAERTGGSLSPVVTTFSTQEQPSKAEIAVILGCLRVMARAVDQHEATNGPLFPECPDGGPSRNLHAYTASAVWAHGNLHIDSRWTPDDTPLLPQHFSKIEHAQKEGTTMGDVNLVRIFSLRDEIIDGILIAEVTDEGDCKVDDGNTISRGDVLHSLPVEWDIRPLIDEWVSLGNMVELGAREWGLGSDTADVLDAMQTILSYAIPPISKYLDGNTVQVFLSDEFNDWDKSLVDTDTLRKVADLADKHNSPKAWMYLARLAYHRIGPHTIEDPTSTCDDKAYFVQQVIDQFSASSEHNDNPVGGIMSALSKTDDDLTDRDLAKIAISAMCMYDRDFKRKVVF